MKITSAKGSMFTEHSYRAHIRSPVEDLSGNDFTVPNVQNGCWKT